MNIGNKILLLICVITIIFLSCDDKEAETTLPSNNILSITIDANGLKWITTGKGIVTFDGKTWKTVTTGTLNADISAQKFLFDADTTWIASLAGLVKSKLLGNTLINNNLLTTQNSSIAGDSVWCAALHSSKTSLFGTENGLSLYKNNKWFTYKGEWGRRSEIFLDKFDISDIACAPDGWNYVTTKGGGVSRFHYSETDAVSGATRFFQPWASGLISDTVYSVCIVNDSCQWFGTNHGAAYHASAYTKADWELNLSKADGLISDTVLVIRADLQNRIWMGTPQGVSVYSQEKITNYSTSNVLPDNAVNCITIDTDGSVWIGTKNGLANFKENKWVIFTKL